MSRVAMNPFVLSQGNHDTMVRAESDHGPPILDGRGLVHNVRGVGLQQNGSISVLVVRS
jgi:hypothetical protein